MEDDALTASFRLSAASFLASIDPDAAAVHIHASFTNPSTPSPLHCPRCARPGLTTRTMPQKTSKARRKQNTMLLRRPSTHSRRINLRRQCSICAYSEEQTLISGQEHEALGSLSMRESAASFTPVGQSDSQNANALNKGATETSNSNIEKTMRGPASKEIVPKQRDYGDGRKPDKPDASERKVEAQPERTSDHIGTNGSDNVRKKPKLLEQSYAPSVRSKKKEGLQAMLQRSKLQRDKAKQTEGSASGGLASFLNSL